MLPGQRLIVPLPFGTVQYRVAVYSDPVVLASGGPASSVEVTLPSSLAAGSHTLVVWALVGSGVVVEGHAFELVTIGPAPGLPVTGGSPGVALAVALGLVLCGLAVVAVSRRRPGMDGA